MKQLSNSTKSMIGQAMKKDNDVMNDPRKKEIPIDLIDPNPMNSQIFNMDGIDRLADAIKYAGFIDGSPIGVFKKSDGRYELYSGERRYLACKSLGMEKIPAIVSPQPKDEVSRWKLLLLSNLNGREYRPLDLARAIDAYKTHVLDVTTDWIDSDSEIGQSAYKMLGKVFFGKTAKSTVQRYLYLLRVIPDLQVLFDRGALPLRLVDSIYTKSEEIQNYYYKLCQEYLTNSKDEKISTVLATGFLERAERHFNASYEDSKEPEIAVPVHAAEREEMDLESVTVPENSQSSAGAQIQHSAPITEEEDLEEQPKAVTEEPEVQRTEISPQVADDEEFFTAADEEEREELLTDVEETIDDAVAEAVDQLVRIISGKCVIADRVEMARQMKRLEQAAEVLNRLIVS